jgi:CheY-like chemotaxis protein
VNKEIPIIALTADVVNLSKNRCLAVGMNDFIGKPMTKEKLREVIKQWLDV